MESIILMRHGIRDGRIDSPLTYFDKNNLDNSCPEIWNKIDSLRYQKIEMIITSPYLRTRQTSELVQYALEKLTGKKIPIYIDNRIGEYVLPKREGIRISKEHFDDETIRSYRGCIPLYRESSEMFISRIKKFTSSLKPFTLIVTHAAPAGLIGIFLGKKISLEEGEFSILQLNCNLIKNTSSIN